MGERTKFEPPPPLMLILAERVAAFVQRALAAPTEPEPATPQERRPSAQINSQEMHRRSTDAIDQELAILNGQIEILERRDRDFERIVEDMQRLQISVRAEKAALEAKGKTLEEERHAINWLPPELLAEIFVLYCEDDGHHIDMSGVYHRPPVTLSHVCHKWREITLSTSRLWSRISCKGSPWNPAPLRLFLERSRVSLLDLVYITVTEKEVTPWDERRLMVQLMENIETHLPRLRSATFQCYRALAIDKIIQALSLRPHSLPHLKSLEFLITEPGPSASTPSLFDDDNRNALEQISSSSKSESSLEHLRLQQVPPSKFPSFFFSGLRSLELCFPPRKLGGPQVNYTLRMSSLCHVLSQTSQLEELTLMDSVPLSDVVLIGDPDTLPPHNHLSHKPIHAIELAQLKRIEWSYPDATDIYRLLTFLITPQLERLDLCLEDPSTKPADHDLRRAYERRDLHVSRVLSYPTVKEFIIQCVGAEVLGGNIFRRLAFPALEKVEFANVDARTRYRDDCSPYPALPRLESIFRDPRLPHLTHLTLSHFEIEPESGRVMLGYMPALTSLSLDTCFGVGALLKSLTEAATIQFAPDGYLVQKGVKFCPQLTSLAFWNCEDVESTGLAEMVKLRNIVDKQPSDNVGAIKKEVDVPPIAQDMLGRKIRPLRKLRRRANGAESPPASSSSAPTIVPTIITLEEALRPTRITSVRVEGCSHLTEQLTASLSRLGVEDIIWREYVMD